MNFEDILIISQTLGADEKDDVKIKINDECFHIKNVSYDFENSTVTLEVDKK